LGWLHVSASKRPSSGHPLINNSIKSKTKEMLAHCGVPWGFTRVVIGKIKKNLKNSFTNNEYSNTLILHVIISENGIASASVLIAM
jgi:hypothetical protein